MFGHYFETMHSEKLDETAISVEFSLCTHWA